MGYIFPLAEAKRLGSPIYRCINTTKYVEEVASYITTNNKYDTFVKGEEVSKEATQMYGLYLGLAGVFALDLLITSDKSEAKLKLYIQTLNFADEYQQYLTYRHGKTVIVTVPYETLFDNAKLEKAVYRIFSKELQVRQIEWWQYFKTCKCTISRLAHNNKLVGYRFAMEDEVTNTFSSFNLDVSRSVMRVGADYCHGKDTILSQVEDKLLTPAEVVSKKDVFDVSDYERICEVLQSKAEGELDYERVRDCVSGS